MRVAPLAVLPYLRPGSSELAAEVGRASRSHDCLLLRNHGLIALGDSVSEAVDRAEELEATARLRFLVGNEPLRHLTSEEVKDLRKVFPRKP